MLQKCHVLYKIAAYNSESCTPCCKTFVALKKIILKYYQIPSCLFYSGSSHILQGFLCVSLTQGMLHAVYRG